MFGEKLSLKRKVAGLNQTELAERVGVSLDTVSRWEKGLREPRLPELKSLSSALGVGLDFWDDDNELEQPAAPLPQRVNKARTVRSASVNNIIFELEENGKKIKLELPPTAESYEFLTEKVAPHLREREKEQEDEPKEN